MEQEKCRLQAPCCCAWGRAAETPSPNPGSCPCSLLAWAASRAEGSDPPRPRGAGAVGLWAACCGENWGLSPERPLGSPVGAAAPLCLEGRLFSSRHSWSTPAVTVRLTKGCAVRFVWINGLSWRCRSAGEPTAGVQLPRASKARAVVFRLGDVH